MQRELLKAHVVRSLLIDRAVIVHCVGHVLPLMCLGVEYFQRSLAGRSTHMCSTNTYMHKVYAQHSFDAMVQNHALIRHGCSFTTTGLRCAPSK